MSSESRTKIKKKDARRFRNLSHEQNKLRKITGVMKGGKNFERKTTEDDIFSTPSTDSSLENLLNFLHNVPSPTPQATQSKSLRYKPKLNSILPEANTQYYHQINTNKSSVIPVSEFLDAMKEFFIYEDLFWERFLTENKEKFKYNKKLYRPWAIVFNNYISIPKKQFKNILNLQRIKKFSSLLSSFIELENERNNMENTLLSVPIIERAKILLHFFQTHKFDPYSSIIGLQASESIITNCLTNACPSNNEEVTLDLSKYIIEVSKLSDSELAKNVRVLSARLRGIFSTIDEGSVVFLSLPNQSKENQDSFNEKENENDENKNQINSTLPSKGINNLYKQIQEFTDSFGLKNQNSASSIPRGVFARCAVKPRNHDNYVGLYLDITEDKNNIFWVPADRIYKLKEEQLFYLQNPKNENIPHIRTFISDYYDQSQNYFKNEIEKMILEYIKNKLNVNEESFARILRSKTLFEDEEIVIQMKNLLQQLIDDNSTFNSLVS